MRKHILDFPLNTQRTYTKVTTYNGCQVFFPVDTRDNDITLARKSEVQQYLNSLAPAVPPLDLA